MTPAAQWHNSILPSTCPNNHPDARQQTMNNPKIPYLSLKDITSMHMDEILQAVTRVTAGGWYLHGEETRLFEQEYARYTGYRHCIGCGNGLDALTMILRAYMEHGKISPGDEIIVPEPAYANYMAFADSAGIRIRPIPSNISEGFALPPVEDFEKKITNRTRAILLCNPNNPTGYVYTRKELEAIADICEQYDLFLFADEVYREFCYTDQKFTSVMSLDRIAYNTVMIDSVSKRYSECGIRIGALVCRNPEIHAAVMKFCQARLSPPLLGQIVAEASVDASDKYIKEVYDEYKKRRDFLVERINRIPGCYAPMPDGAFYTMVELPVDDADKFCKWCLEEFEYEGGTVFLAPGSGFYSNPAMGRRQARIAYVHNIDYLAKGLDILEHALEAYPNRIKDLGL